MLFPFSIILFVKVLSKFSFIIFSKSDFELTEIVIPVISYLSDSIKTILKFTFLNSITFPVKFGI